MHYRERLRVPAIWWLTALFFAVSTMSAIGFYLGPEFAVVAGLVTVVAITAGLLAYGSVEIVVDSEGLLVGGSRLEWPYLGEVKVHDRKATQHRMGAGADPSAWLVHRGYLPGSVEITLADPLDPHPYWLVSSQDPQGLADAIQTHRPITAPEAE